MTISEVDQKYGRPVDYGDVAIENDESFQPFHYGLHERLAKNVKKPYGYFARFIANKLCLCLPSEIVCCRMEESGETLERAQPVLAGLGLVL